LRSSPQRRSSLDPAEWFQWRGANRDGISQEPVCFRVAETRPPLAGGRTASATAIHRFQPAGGSTRSRRGGIECDRARSRERQKVWETQNGQRYQNDRGDSPAVRRPLMAIASTCSAAAAT
jgi:hypothetical protein